MRCNSSYRMGIKLSLALSSPAFHAISNWVTPISIDMRFDLAKLYSAENAMGAALSGGPHDVQPQNVGVEYEYWYIDEPHCVAVCPASGLINGTGSPE